MKLSLSIIAAISCVQSTNAFAGVKNQSKNVDISRRESFANVAALVGGIAGVATIFPNVVSAEPTDETARIITKMGGLLVSCSFPFIFAQQTKLELLVYSV